MKYSFETNSFKTKTRKILQFLLATAFLLLCTAFAIADDFNFAVITDTNIGIGSIVLAKQSDAVVSSIIHSPQKIDFVIHLGNMVAGSSSTTAEDAEKMWQEYNQKIVSQLSDKQIGILLIANQQDKANVASENNYINMFKSTKHDFASSAAVKENYAFVYKDNLFIVLQYDKNIDKSWLKEQLEKNYQTVDHVFVFSVNEFAAIAKEKTAAISCNNCNELFAALDSYSNKYGNKITLFTSSSQVYFKGDYKGYDVVSVGAIDEPHTIIGVNERQKAVYSVVAVNDKNKIIYGVEEPFDHWFYECRNLPLIQPKGYDKFNGIITGCQQIEGESEDGKGINKKYGLTQSPCIIPPQFEGYEEYTRKRGLNINSFNEKHPEYDAIILEASQKFNVPFELIKAIIMEESGGNPFPSKESLGGKICNKNGCLCNEQGYCGLMGTGLDYVCLTQAECNKEAFIKGSVKDQIFAGTAILQRIIKKKSCKLDNKNLLEDINNPQYIMHLFGCYGKGIADNKEYCEREKKPCGYPVFLRRAMQKNGKPLEKITPIDIATVTTTANAIVHSYIKEIKLDLCKKGVINDQITHPINQNLIAVQGQSALAKVGVAKGVSTVYYLTPNFRIPIDNSLNDYKTIREAATQLVTEINDCRSHGNNVENCFSISINNQKYKTLGITADNLLCKENKLDKFIYDSIENMKTCSKLINKKCSINIPLQYPGDAKLDENEIAFVFSSADEKTTLVSVFVNNILYTTDKISGSLALFEDLIAQPEFKDVKNATILLQYDKYQFKRSILAFTFENKNTNLDENKEENKDYNYQFALRDKIISFVFDQDNKLSFFSDKLTQPYIAFAEAQQQEIEELQNLKKGFKLCYLSRNTMYANSMFDATAEDTAYYEKNLRYPTRLRNLVYRFALLFDISQAIPHTSIVVSDLQKAEKTVLVKFNKPSTPVKYYTLFFSADKNSLELPTNELMKKDSVMKIILDPSTAKTASVDDYTLPGNEIIAGRLYYNFIENMYFIAITVDDESKQYYFAVAGMSVNNKEPNNVDADQKLEIVEGSSADDLAPMPPEVVVIEGNIAADEYEEQEEEQEEINSNIIIAAPMQGKITAALDSVIDNSNPNYLLTDLDGYFAVIYENKADASLKLTKENCNTENNCQLVSAVLPENKDRFEIEFNGLNDDTKYMVVVYAVDTSGNYLEIAK
ncbi:hypothetical protein J4232_05855 [Candidatus Woesearchaeota archaeon]|nr:hypothetical protein [Candidatus Woesearchaeota archaeon]